MTDYCVNCARALPDNQGSRTCSMCYGDPYHGRDGFYLAELERAQEEEYMRSQEQKAQEER